MKYLQPLALLALTFCAAPFFRAAETKAAPPAIAHPTAKSFLAGSYTGKWKSSGDASGELRIKLKQDGEAAWVAEATFTFESTEVPTKVKLVEIEGASVRLVFDWEAEGSAAQSKLTGELKGDTLHGTYESKGGSGSSHGTWTVTRS